MLKMIHLLALYILFLSFTTGLRIPKRNGPYTMNQNGVTWDASCDLQNPQNTGETRRIAVERAWVGALELIDTAWTRFDGVTYPIIKLQELSVAQQREVDRKDPAYVTPPIILSVFYLIFVIDDWLASIDTSSSSHLIVPWKVCVLSEIY